MFTNMSFGLRFACIIFGGIVFCQFGVAGENDPMTKQEVLQLLPVGVDMLDATLVSNYQKLVASGPRSYSALAEVLNDADDPIIVGRIFAVFVESKGDKTIAINAVKSTIKKYQGKSNPNAAKVRVYAAQTLGEIGTPNDCSVLYDMVNDGDERVRTNAIRALTKAGDEKALAVILRFIDTRKANASQEEMQKDTSIQEGTKAVELIKKRLAESKSSTTSK